MGGRAARVSERGARRVRAGHPWVFRADVESQPDAAGGAIVAVTDSTGNPLGRAFWARTSRIALRMLTRDPAEIDPRAFLQERIARSLSLRRLLYPDGDAFRAVHGEADGLPGLFVDRYGDALSVQAVSEGADAQLPLLVELLAAALQPRVVVARNDGSAREFEGLPRTSGVLAGGPVTEAVYHEGPSAFRIDLMKDLKTGAFLDQRENHLHAAAYVPAGGSALDAFSYHGGFALSLATKAARTVAIEQDPAAASRLTANAEANGRTVEVVHGNAFDELRRLERERAAFDVVVIDPPALAKRQSGLPAAERAYKELNLRGAKLVKPGGVLITCSCSGKMTPDRFGRVVESALSDAHRTAQLLERRGAARDHPALAGVPETEYLKCWVYRLV